MAPCRAEESEALQWMADPLPRNSRRKGARRLYTESEWRQMVADETRKQSTISGKENGLYNGSRSDLGRNAATFLAPWRRSRAASAAMPGANRFLQYALTAQRSFRSRARWLLFLHIITL